MHVATNREKERLFPSLDVDALIEAVAERVVAKVLERMPAIASNSDDALLLTIEQAAVKLGRTVPAVEHLIRENKLPVVRFDRRVSVDIRDILLLVDNHKQRGTN